MASRDVRCTSDCTCRGNRDGRHPFDTACASSLDAVGTTARFIQGGLADVAVCGA
ncbi:MAG: beta-ketoacyl synthase N-terminal-like domain-containing protein, partial [Acidimicrobiales bacterium]